MTKIQADVSIVGGGMVGMSLAIALAVQGHDVALVERTPLAAQLQPDFDGRVSAISWSSRNLFKHIGAWERLEEHAQPINEIRVSDNDSYAFVHYHAEGLAGHPFGYLAENRYIRHALQLRAAELKNITLLAPRNVQSSERDTYSTRLILDGGDTVHAPLLISAEGRNSSLREQAGIKARELQYGQTALVCTIEHSLPHGGLAQERFLPSGPFAVLPMTGNRSSLVWTEPEGVAPVYLQMDDAKFAAEIKERLGEYLGDIKPVGKRFSYPLRLLHAERYTDTRLALVGDAAHAIHPLAGQGVNLGFRDVAVLSSLLREYAGLGVDIGSQALLARYQQWRSFDSIAMLAITDGLNRLFSNDLTLFKMARRLGMAAVNSAPRLKGLFTQHAMGLTGDLPELLRDKAG